MHCLANAPLQPGRRRRSRDGEREIVSEREREGVLLTLRRTHNRVFIIADKTQSRTSGSNAFRCSPRDSAARCVSLRDRGSGKTIHPTFMPAKQAGVRGGRGALRMLSGSCSRKQGREAAIEDSFQRIRFGEEPMETLALSGWCQKKKQPASRR